MPKQKKKNFLNNIDDITGMVFKLKPEPSVATAKLTNKKKTPIQHSIRHRFMMSGGQFEC